MRYTLDSTAYVRAAMAASLAPMSGKSASRRPKAVRSDAYRVAMPRAGRIPPMQAAPSLKRPDIQDVEGDAMALARLARAARPRR